MYKTLSTLTLVFFMISVFTTPALGDVDASVVTETLQQRICYEIYWWNRNDYQREKPVSVTFRRDGDNIYTWIDDLLHPLNVARWINLFTIFTKDGRNRVVTSEGSNFDKFQGSSYLKQKRSQIFSEGMKVTKLVIPVDCAPKFEIDTEKKQKMINAIENTISDELSSFNRSKISNYPETIKIVIANFNYYYPETFVLIDGTNDIFSVTLHDDTDPGSDNFLESGKYPIQPKNKGATKSLMDKIVQNGIVRIIHLIN